MNENINREKLEKIAKFIRYLILTSTTEAGSGHPTSCLSAVELLTTLFFAGFFQADLDDPQNPVNDRLIFSKGHAAPLLYALYTVAGKVSIKQLLTLRKFSSPLEGHPIPSFPFVQVATGSLGQGLSIGVGMALNGKYLDKIPYRTFVLLGDSEMSEGSNWEAIQIASYYRLDNLIGIIDVNRLGQRGETMYAHNIKAYQKRIEAFGWRTFLVEDGHSFDQISKAYSEALKSKNQPSIIIAKTIKGKGISFLEGKNGYHGKALNKNQLEQALKELSPVDTMIKEELKKPSIFVNTYPKSQNTSQKLSLSYKKKELVSTRKAYGNALVRIFPYFPQMVVLDAEVSNSTFAQIFKEKYPENFFEMFIAEQNMAAVALGLSSCKKIPFASTFAAFWGRAFDQIRMSQYSQANIKFIGCHAGVSVGEDGPSQMGLEDIAIFRSILESAVLYSADAVSTEKLVEEAAKYQGIVYIRTTRPETPIIYNEDETFPIGGCKTLRQSEKDQVSVVAAGITLHEALKAYEILKKENIFIRVIDLYSVKPIDEQTLKEAARQTKAIVTVEDHYPQGGIGEAVASTLAQEKTPIFIMAVQKLPKSGSWQKLLQYEEICADSIVKKVKEIVI